MSDTGLHSGATRTESAYERLDRAIMAARQLAAGPSHKPLEEPDSSAANELAYLLASQEEEAQHDFVLGPFQSQAPDEKAAAIELRAADPAVEHQTKEGLAPQLSAHRSVSAPWLRLMGPAVITAQIVALAVLAIIWMPGAPSESLAHLFGRKGRMTIHPWPGSMTIAQAEIPPANLAESEVIPFATSIAGVAAPDRTEISHEGIASPAPIDIQPNEPAEVSSPQAADIARSDAPPELSTPGAMPPQDETVATVTESMPDKADVGLHPFASSETEFVREQSIQEPSAADPPASRVQEAASEAGAEGTSVATLMDEQPRLPLPANEVSPGEPVVEEARYMPPPEGSVVEETPEDAAAGKTGELPHDAPVLQAEDPAGHLVRMAAALAAEQRAALERERDRVDALARELASTREELTALRTRPAVPVSMNLSLPLSAPESPSQMTDPKPPSGATGNPASAGVGIAHHAAPIETRQNASAQSAPSSPHLSSADEQRLLGRAEALLRVRDVSGARLLLERAAERGSAQGILLLAQTYDPDVLSQWRVLGISGDPEKARKLYEKSRVLKAREATAATTLP